MQNKLFIVTALFLFFFLKGEFNLISQPSCLIYSNLTESDTVDFGKCLIGDSIICSFTIKNTGTTPLRVVSYDPSFVIGIYKNYLKEFEEFETKKSFPINIGISSEEVIEIKYKASTVLTAYPPGKKHAILKIGVFNPETAPDTIKESDIVYTRTFLMIARKTTKFVDGNEELIEIDSVYKNPADTIKIPWNMLNLSSIDINVNSVDFSMLSPIANEAEFSVKMPNLPLEMLPKRNFIWFVNYYPTDLTGDSCRLQCFYQSKILNPYVEDSCFVVIKAIGVEHNLKINDFQSDEFSGDTLIFGNHRFGTSKELLVVIENQGNLPYGVLNQKIESILQPTQDVAFNVTKPFLQNNAHLYQNKFDTIKIRFNPTELGNYIAKYTIESNVGQRKILGVPYKAKYFTFYLKGTATEPRISTFSDTIDFGNIVLSPECTNSRDTLIPVTNFGNEELKVFSVTLNPPPPISKFSIIEYPSVISPNKTEYIKINFSSNSIGEEHSDLIITTNANRPNDILVLPLRATGVPLVAARLSIPTTIKARPGTPISFPIIINNKNLRYARNFTDTLNFDKTLLSYHSYQIFSTAAEVADQISINQIADEGRLHISVSVPYTTYFLPRDTLIILKFYTYLGENISTPIAFVNPKVGDGICTNVLNIEKVNGLFSLDSVCGLDLKVVPITKPIVAFKEIYPNPGSDIIKIEYELNEEAYIRISIFNVFGEKIKDICSDKNSKGEHIFEYPCSELVPGFYYCELSSNTMKEIRRFLISR